MAFGALVAVVILAGSCSSSNVSTETGSLRLSPTQTAEPATPIPSWTPLWVGTPSPIPTASPTDYPWVTDEPEPTAAPTPKFKTKSGKIETLMGKAGPLAPAKDGGKLAATEINDFGFDLLRRMDPTGNICVSPTSIALALAMMRAGAKGQTATEMDAVMRSLGSDPQANEIVELLAALKNDNYSETGDDDSGRLVTVQKARLDLANAAFGQHGLSIEQTFLDALSSRFASGMYLVDYVKDAEAARKVINNWVYDHTQGRIPEILAPGDVDSSTLIALANAMYLQAAWSKEFDAGATKSLSFNLGDGSKVTVPTMSEGDDLPYAAGTGWRAVDIPYYGWTMAMTIIVPDDMTSFVAGLNAAALAKVWKVEKTYGVTLTLPRFKADSHFDLSDILKALGMPTAFASEADFSGITTDQPIAIGRVIHQANIDVNEKGTTAAAATVVTGRGTVGGPGDPIPSVTFHVDHPFLFVIHDLATGAVLFTGRIDDPSAIS